MPFASSNCLSRRVRVAMLIFMPSISPALFETFDTVAESNSRLRSSPFARRCGECEEWISERS